VLGQSFGNRLNCYEVRNVDDDDDDNDNNNNNNNFSGYLLKCRLNSTSAYYKVNTRTQIRHKNNTSTQKENTKQTKQKLWDS